MVRLLGLAPLLAPILLAACSKPEPAPAAPDAAPAAAPLATSATVTLAKPQQLVMLGSLGGDGGLAGVLNGDAAPSTTWHTQ